MGCGLGAMMSRDARLAAGSELADLSAVRNDAASSLRHPLSRALLALTFTTGLVDAVSFLALGNVFTANVTGNIIFLGFGIAGVGGLSILAPLTSFGFFLVGALFGGVVAKRLADQHPTHVAVALGAEVSLVGIAALIAALVDIHANELSGDVLIALLALAMGLRNATARRIAVPDMTTTLLTLSLTGLAADSVIAGGTGAGHRRRIAGFVMMLTGVVVGGLLLKTSISLPLALVSAVGALTAFAYVPWARRNLAAG